MCFETVYIAVLIKVPFEFTRFFKLQNIVKNRIHFNTSYRGAYSQMYFLLKGKNWGGGAYKRRGASKRRDVHPRGLKKSDVFFCLKEKWAHNWGIYKGGGGGLINGGAYIREGL